MTFQPSRRLMRDAKLLSIAAGLCLAVTAVIDVLAVGAFATRSAYTGLSNGGFAFLIDCKWFCIADGPDRTFIPIGHFTIAQSMLATALLALRLVPGLIVLWSLMRLFGVYGRGEIFTDRNTRYVRTIAWALIGYAGVPLVTHAMLFVADMSPVLVKWEVRQLDALSAGLILLAVAHVVSFGRALDEDSRGFV